MIPRISSKEQAWEDLDVKCGNRGVTILRTINKLVQAVLTAVAAYNKVEALLNNVRAASSCIKALDAEKRIVCGLLPL